jgi:D-alanine-D-alanine ligase
MTRKKKLRVIMLADETLLPDGDLKDFSEKQRELRKTEFDVRDAIEALGHDLFSIGVSDDLSTIRGAIDAHKPHIVFNLVEEFAGRHSASPAPSLHQRALQPNW